MFSSYSDKFEGKNYSFNIFKYRFFPIERIRTLYYKVKHNPRSSLFILITILIFIYTIFNTRHTIVHFTRPIWDKNIGKRELWPNYGYNSEKSCELHGWNVRKDNPKVFDCILFNDELDLLEIRIHELYDVVDVLIIIESPTTFTGKQKKLYFNENKERFEQFSKKIVYISFDFPDWIESESINKNRGIAWVREWYSRIMMLSGLKKGGIKDGDLVIIADVDEIPRVSSVKLAKYCETPIPFCMSPRFYLYSFEWEQPLYDYDHFGGTPNIYQYFKSNFSIIRESNTRCLADAAWHCSWCFPTIEQFIRKVESYSHREHDRAEFKTYSSIQKKICNGMDLFERWEEAKTFKGLAQTYDSQYRQIFNTHTIPQYIVNNPDKFSYLLPGHCKDRIDFIK